MRIPAVIVIVRNIQVAKAMMVDSGISQTKRLLTNRCMILVVTQREIHTAQ